MFLHSTFPIKPVDRPVEVIRHIKELPTDLTELMAMGGVVIDLIPDKDRRKYNYFRGASLPAHLLSLVTTGSMDIGGDGVTHFASGPPAHTYAKNVATSIAFGEGYDSLELPRVSRAHWEEEFGTSLPPQTPSIIFALGHNLNNSFLPESNIGAKEGYIWQGTLTPDMVDPYSKKIFKIIE